MRLAVLLAALFPFCGQAIESSVCTHSRPCGRGYVCVFGDQNEDADDERDESGKCFPVGRFK